jgi:hypothetical protein
MIMGEPREKNIPERERELATMVGLLMRGAIDMHIHAAPDPRTLRVQDMIQVAEDARRKGMRAIMFKDHDGNTATSAYLVKKVVAGIEVFGGICLDYALGGLNPSAVDIAIKCGAKCVWMPGLDSAWTIRRVRKTKEAKGLAPRARHSGVPYTSEEEGISIFKEGIDGDTVKPEVIEILRIVAENDIIIDTGHLSPKESFALLSEAKKAGAKKFVCNHVNSQVIGKTFEELKEFAKQGAYLNYCIMQTIDDRYRRDPLEIVEQVKAIGASQCIFSTDLGQIQNIPPVDGMELFIRRMLVEGLDYASIEIACKKNPAMLLGLD